MGHVFYLLFFYILRLFFPLAFQLCFDLSHCVFERFSFSLYVQPKSFFYLDFHLPFKKHKKDPSFLLMVLLSLNPNDKS